MANNEKRLPSVGESAYLLRRVSELAGRLAYDMEHRQGAYLHADRDAIRELVQYREKLDTLAAFFAANMFLLRSLHTVQEKYPDDRND
jgi:hypothetical protein